MSTIIQAVTTTGSREEAERIAATLVERGLAACVQISGPITSTYPWEGKIETSQEWCCTIKTLRSHFAELEAALGELHSYDVPELLAVEVVESSPAYRQWLTAAVGSRKAGG